MKQAEKDHAQWKSGKGEAGDEPVEVDRGIPNPERALAKAKLVQRIHGLIEERKLTQAKAAALLGIDQPKVSALVRGQVGGDSLDRLIRFLHALGQHVENTVRAAEGAAPHTIVH